MATFFLLSPLPISKIGQQEQYSATIDSNLKVFSTHIPLYSSLTTHTTTSCILLQQRVLPCPLNTGTTRICQVPHFCFQRQIQNKMVQLSDAACSFSKPLQQEHTSTEDKLRSIMNFPQLKLFPKTEFPQHHVWMPIKRLRQKKES